MIIFTHAVEGDYNPEKLDPPWRAWHNCEDRDQAVAMAAQKLLRERGGMGELRELLLTVYTYTEKTPLHDSGRPMYVKRDLLKATAERGVPV